MANLYTWIDERAEAFFSYFAKHAITLLVCVAVNLGLVVVMLALGLSTMTHYPPSEVELLIPQDESTPLTAEAMGVVEDDEHVQGEINALTRAADIRNTVRDLSQAPELRAGLRDEKNIDAEKLYSDAQRAREEMQTNAQRAKEQVAREYEEAALKIPNTKTTSTAVPERVHRGPSVVSYSLPGRKARAMPVPAYQCEAGGLVVMLIWVDQQGYVQRVAVDSEKSTGDPCLQQAAIAAAKGSIFSVDAQGPRQSQGSITYLFVAQ